MSKDWTPAEHYYVDKMFASQGNSFRDDTFYFVTAEGDEVPLQNQEVREKYPELSFIGGDVFDKIYERYGNSEGVRNLFDTYEEILKGVEAEFDKGECIGSKELWKLTPEDLYKQTPETVMREWFHGKLDPNFYYCERNNDILFSYVNNQAEKIVIKELKKQSKFTRE